MTGAGAFGASLKDKEQRAAHNTTDYMNNNVELPWGTAWEAALKQQSVTNRGTIN